MKLTTFLAVYSTRVLLFFRTSNFAEPRSLSWRNIILNKKDCKHNIHRIMDADKGKQEGAKVAPREAVTSVSRNVRELVTQLDSDVLDDKLRALYDRCAQLIRKSIGGEPFTADKIALVIATVSRAIQDFSQAQTAPLTGVEKQTIALNLTKHILKDFRDNGQLTEEAYQDILISVMIVGPTLVNLIVSAWKKAVTTGQDISANGCSGCAKRNCCVQ
jgi:hypothetical protein